MTNTSQSRLHLVWRVIIVMAAASLVWIANGLLFSVEEYSRLWHFLSAGFVLLLVVPIVVIARRYLDRRLWEGLRLTSLAKGWKALIVGALCYLLPAFAGLLIFILMGWIQVSIQMAAGDWLIAVLTVTALVFIYEALPEELLFRGYLYRNLNSVLPHWQAVIGQAFLFLLFAWIIGAAPSWNRIVFFFGFGIVVGIIRVVTDNVWSAIGFHLAFQTMQQFFSNRGGYEISSSNSALMEMVILGAIPFTFAILTLNILVRKQPDWKAVNPE
ncbi:CPBP family intramembrane glutamic endopeptidase [Paenibacillus senegalensis]|uniref:CPBP family intramembrane glutamic endopeptidase n=1 Tax=Paenibacillus senegalensis TaxID=1465766 RepID=UPI00028836AE|nr:type II CAAX endopeptidase family protein [Paenibacillus senegalensis]